MNEPSHPTTFDPNRKCYAFARRFLISATCVAAAAVSVLLPASAQGQARGNARVFQDDPAATKAAAAKAPVAAAVVAPAPVAAAVVAPAPVAAAVVAPAAVAAAVVAPAPVAAAVVAPAAVATSSTIRVQPSAPQQSQVVSEAGVVAPKVAAPTGLGFKPAHFEEFVTVMVELVDRPAALVYADALKAAVTQAGGSLARMSPAVRASVTESAVSQAKVHVTKLEAAQQAIVPKLNSMARDGQVIFRTKSAYNGISMYARRSQIAELEKLPGVKAVHIQIPKFQTAATDIDFLGARTAWTKATQTWPFGIHGENVKVAIIDSGLDYVHTDFGGPGTQDAYASITDAGAPNAYFPSFKVPGGYDFAGDAYTGSNTPVPDANPFDDSIIGHGTSCASLIGGLGVTSAGATYVGLYNNTTDIASLKISPGFAPRCFLYPLRVFGVTGSTNLVVQAIDWAIDPNGDGNIANHMDVISMSLGSNTGSPTDPDCIAATNAATAGIIVCSAAGNAGDSYYIVSAPSVATGTLSVAATYNNTGGFFYNSNVTGNAPAALAGVKFSSIQGLGATAASALIPAGGLTGNIVYAVPPDASTALTNAAAVNGNICLIDRGTVSFVTKVQAAQNAGALGVIIVQSAGGSGTPYPITMALDATVIRPAVMIGLNDGNTIKAQFASGTVSGTINNDNGFVNAATTAADTMATYSARGPRLGDSALKPDLSAPAEVVGVAHNLTGSAVQSFNGTSSATPHVAGMMTLLRQLHPTWSVEELSALAVNTSTHNLFVGPSTGGGAQYGTGRAGPGRIDIGLAATASVIAYNQTDRGFLNVSFGAVEVPVDSSVTQSKNITVSNKGAVDVTYNITYTDVTPVNGATFTVGSGSAVTVPAGGTITVPVTFTATGNLLKHIREASVTANLPTARQWLTEKTGFAVLTPTGGVEPTIRVALYASPKPVGSMHATPSSILPAAATGSFTLNLTGASINTGTTFNSATQDIVGLVKPFELSYVSTLAGSANPPVDPNVIKYVGVTSDYILRGAAPQGTILTFAVEGFGNASTPDYNGSDKEIYISIDGGNTFAYAVYLSSTANGAATSNAYYPFVVNLATGATAILKPTNGISPSGSTTSRDTNSYNNSVVTFPIGVGTIGLTASTSTSQIYYDVVTYDRNGNQVDDSGLLFYDMAKPGLDVQGGNLDPFFYQDLATQTIPVNYSGANYQSNGALGLLLAHMHNATGSHTEVVTFARPTLAGFSPASGKIGSQVQITGTNFGPGTVVTFFNGRVASSVQVISSTTILVNVPAGTVTGVLKVSNAAGGAVSPTKFTVTP